MTFNFLASQKRLAVICCNICCCCLSELCAAVPAAAFLNSWSQVDFYGRSFVLIAHQIPVVVHVIDIGLEESLFNFASTIFGASASWVAGVPDAAEREQNFEATLDEEERRSGSVDLVLTTRRRSSF